MRRSGNEVSNSSLMERCSGSDSDLRVAAEGDMVSECLGCGLLKVKAPWRVCRLLVLLSSVSFPLLKGMTLEYIRLLRSQALFEVHALAIDFGYMFAKFIACSRTVLCLSSHTRATDH